MTKQKPTIISHIPEEGFQDETDVVVALRVMKELIQLEREDCAFNGEWSDRSDEFAIFVAYPLYTTELVQCPHTDEEAFDLEIIPHPQNFKLADGKTNVFQLVKELHQANNRIAALEPENEKLRAIAEGAAKTNLIDATDESGKIVFRMSMEGEQLFNPPQFVRLAKEFIGDHNILQGGK